MKYKVDVNVADNVSMNFFSSTIDINGVYNVCSSLQLNVISVCLTPFFCQEGWTPLHVAMQTRNRDIVKVLLVNGADKTRRNKVSLQKFYIHI